MGASLTYLRKPRTTPHLEHVEVAGRAHVASGQMQGWRRSMEDAHAVFFDAASDALLVAVFDGHGGKGVALYAAQRLPSLLTSLASYRRREFGLALHEAFLALDAEMETQQTAREQIRKLDRAVTAPAANEEEDDGESTRVRVDLDSLVQIFGDSDGNGALRPRRGVKNVRRVIEAALAKNENPLPRIFEGPALEKFKPTPESLTKYDVEISDVFEALVHGQDGDPAHQGCTATAAVVDFARLEIVCANAGDSRTMLGRDGRAALLSVDHKPSDPAEKQRVIAAGGRVHGRGEAARVQADLNLSRALGDFRYKLNAELPAELQMISAMPDVRTRKLCKKDKFLLLACDGIWEKLPTDEAIEFLDERVADEETKDEPIRKNLDQSIRAALSAAICQNLDMDSIECDFTGCDNMTLMLVRFSDDFRATLPDSVDEPFAAPAPTVHGLTVAPKKRKLQVADTNVQRIKKRRASGSSESSSVSQ